MPGGVTLPCSPVTGLTSAELKKLVIFLLNFCHNYDPQWREATLPARALGGGLAEKAVYENPPPMMSVNADATGPRNRRVLIVDDNRAIHDDIRKSLAAAPSSTPETEEMEALLFGDKVREAPGPPAVHFEISSAYQGEEGIEHVHRAISTGAPFALAFMDVRMPPGLDGIEALARIWQEDPALQAVICSAYSDYSWAALIARLPQVDRFLVLKKPFDSVEIRQMAYSLTEKWNAHADGSAAYASLHKSKESQRAVLRAIPDTILRLDADGACLDFKPPTGASAALAAYGAALPAEMARHFRDSVRRAIGERITQRVEFELPVGPGVCSFDAQIASLEGEEAVAVVRDITETKRASAKEALGREREAIIRAQAEALSQLSMPFIPITERVAVMPLIGDMDGKRVERIRETLVQRLADQRASAVIIDLTGVENVAAAAVVQLVRMVQAVALLGTELILTGIRGAVARRLVELGADFRGAAMRQTLQEGIDLAMRRRGA